MAMYRVYSLKPAYYYFMFNININMSVNNEIFINNDNNSKNNGIYFITLLKYHTIMMGNAV